MSDDIRDIKGLIAIPGGLPLWAIGLLVLAAVAAAFLLWRRHRARRATAPVPMTPPRPPHELALEALDRLARDPLPDAGAVKRFHFALSEIARSYVEGRYPIPASDMTTEEILEALPGVHELGPAQAESLRRLLRDADLVKFTDHDPGPEASRALLARARSLVLETRPVPPPATEARG